MTDTLQAGWAEADITPIGREVDLDGQFYHRRTSEIHSRLGATVLVLERANECSALISFDLLNIPRQFVQILRQAITAAVPSLSADRIVINVTHTHSVPVLTVGTHPFWTPSAESMPPDEFAELVKTRTVAAAREAYASRRPARVTTATEFVSIGHCRRPYFKDGKARMYGHTNREDFVGMEGGEDAGVELMFFADAQDTPTGAIVNVACPSQVMEATYKISSDYMGALREKLKETFGPSFKTLPQISAAGCQSPRDLTRHGPDQTDLWGEAGVDRIASRLAETVKRAWPQHAYQWCEDTQFDHHSFTMDLPKRRVTTEECHSAKAEVDRLETIMDSQSAYHDYCEQVRSNEQLNGGMGPYDDKEHHFVQIRNNEAVIRRYDEQSEIPNITLEVHVIRLGDAVIATNPFELYLEFGQRIKARSPAKQTFLVQLSNGVEKYLPSKTAERLGGYGGLIINGEVGSDAGDQLVAATLDGVAQVFTT